MLKLILIAGYFAATLGQLLQESLEFENTLSDSQKRLVQPRSQASGWNTLRLEDANQSYTIQFSICAQPIDPSRPVTVYIDDIRYSNDGPSDYIYITMDTEVGRVQVGTFKTKELWIGGGAWNIFWNSDKVGKSLHLVQGTYNIQIKVATDKYGVELDKINIKAENQNQTQTLICSSEFIMAKM